jgi:ABC-type Fe3+/spermidine/putrescine transport system ATPase subunit
MLEVQEIHKSYEGSPLLTGVSFRVEVGEILALLGPSGSGKSTLLRIIAGLETPEAGRILWDGRDLSPVPVPARGFGLVFQDYALFPHLNVASNIGYGLRLRRQDPEQIRGRVADLLARVGLSGFEARRIGELSGGEQQRVALARALAIDPKLLLFDEPLGALDRSLRERLLSELRAILQKNGVPAIYVTHDQEEAFALADRVALLHAGRIVRMGTPDQVWLEPGSAWAAGFLGAGNLVDGIARQGAVETAWGVFPLTCSHVHAPGERLALLLRREGVRLDPAGELEAVVADTIFQKDHYQVRFENGLEFHLPERPRVGERLRLHLPEHAFSCLGDETDHGH